MSGHETPRATAHPAVLDAYEKGFADGVTETISQLRERFDLGLIPAMDVFLHQVAENVERPS